MAANRGLHDVFASYAAEGHDRLDERIERCGRDDFHDGALSP